MQNSYTTVHCIIYPDTRLRVLGPPDNVGRLYHNDDINIRMTNRLKSCSCIRNHCQSLFYIDYATNFDILRLRKEG